MSRVKDPDLMHELKDLWREFGCSVCGRGTDEAPPEGFDVELHHVIARSKDGPDAAWNIVGLCGGLTENRCHQQVTENVYEIQRNEQGILVWRDRRAGGQLWKSLRFIPQHSQIPPPGGSDGSAVDDTPGVDAAEPEPYSDAWSEEPVASEDPPREEGAALVLEPTGAAPTPDDSPELRATQIRDRVTAAKRLTMEAAILLLAAYDRGDHGLLGVAWPDYCGSLGLERSTVSKMLSAARTLGDQWIALAPAAREHIALEGLYQGSLLVTRAGWDPEAAIDAVVSNPTSRLVALRVGDEPTERCKCRCETCGKEDVWHDRA